jgi:predicted nucleic acid-binding protein
VVIASITASELLEGVHRANTERRRAARESFVENLLGIVPVVPFDLRVARAYARLRARLPRAAAVGAHDLIIAATAVALDFGVLTRDRRSFPRIPDLDVVLC